MRFYLQGRFTNIANTFSPSQVRHYLFVILFSLCAVTAFADDQMQFIDSLYRQLNEQKGEQRINTLVLLSEAFRQVSLDKSLKTGEEAMSYAEEEGMQSMKGKILKSLGISAYVSGDFDLALAYYQKAAAAYESVNDKAGKAAVTNNIGLIYKAQGQSQKAITYYNEARKLQEETGNEKAYASTTINVAGLYYQLGDLDQALDAFYQSQMVYKKLQDTVKVAVTTYSMALVYWQWDQNDKALEMLNEALQVFREHDMKLDIARTYYNMGLIYAYDKGNNEKAMSLFLQSLEMREKIGNPQGTANVIVNIANIWIEQGRFDQAFELYDRGLRMAQSMKYVDGIVMTYYYMGIAYQKMRDFHQSNESLQACLKEAQQHGIHTYDELVNEALLKNYAGLGDFDRFSDAFKAFQADRDSIAAKYNKLQTAEAHARYKIDEILPEMDALMAQNKQQKEQIKVYRFAFSAFALLTALSIIIWLMARRRKKLHTDAISGK